MNLDILVTSAIITILIMYVYYQYRNYIHKLNSVKINSKQASEPIIYLLNIPKNTHKENDTNIPSVVIGSQNSAHSNAITAAAFKSKK